MESFNALYTNITEVNLQKLAFKKLIHLYLSTDRCMKISLQSLEHETVCRQIQIN